MSRIGDLIGYWGQRTHALKSHSTVRYKYARDFQNNLGKSSDQIQFEQFDRLKNIIKYAYKNCAWYKENYDRVGFNPGDLKDFSEIAKLPILTKQDIWDNLDGFLSKRFRPNQRIEAVTGGTTGRPFKFYRDSETNEYRRGVEMAVSRYYGWKDGQWQGWLWAASQDLVNYASFKERMRNLLVNRIYCLDTKVLSDETYESFVQRTKKYNPRFVSSYPSLAYDLAVRMETKQVSRVKVPVVAVTAEPLYEFQRQKIESVWAGDVYSRYGTREFGIAAFECTQKKGYHIVTDSVYMETIKDERITGDLGTLIISDLHNRAMPLIRYRMGDYARIDDTPCDCGINTPRMFGLKGREIDVIWRPDGTGMSGFHWIILIIHSELRAKAQVVQTRLNEVIIKIEGKLADHLREIDKLKELIDKEFGTTFDVHFEEVDQIKRAASGKYQFIVSRIQRPE